MCTPTAFCLRKCGAAVPKVQDYVPRGDPVSPSRHGTPPRPHAAAVLGAPPLLHCLVKTLGKSKSLSGTPGSHEPSRLVLCPHKKNSLAPDFLSRFSLSIHLYTLEIIVIAFTAKPRPTSTFICLLSLAPNLLFFGNSNIFSPTTHITHRHHGKLLPVSVSSWLAALRRPGDELNG